MADRLRIAMVTYYLPSASKIGVGYQVHALANYMEDRGHSVTVFTPCPPTNGARYTTVQIPLPDRLRTFSWAFAIRKVDFAGFDVLHAHGDDHWLWQRRAPVHVRTVHGSCFAEARRIPGAREKLRMVLLGLSETLASVVADRTVVVSPDTRRYMPWVKTVIPNGVDERNFYPDDSMRAAEPTILFVGTYLNRKRGKLLAEAFQNEVRQAIPKARLVMVCSDAPEMDGVTITGRISDRELADWYRRAWVFCLPSTYEGFGIPYAEALLSGTPVIATDNPGARFVLNGHPAGKIVTDTDMGRTLIDMLRGNAHHISSQDFFRLTMSETVQAYENIYAIRK